MTDIIYVRKLTTDIHDLGTNDLKLFVIGQQRLFCKEYLMTICNKRKLLYYRSLIMSKCRK